MGCGQSVDAQAGKIRPMSVLVQESQINLQPKKAIRSGSFNFHTEVEEIKKRILSIPEDKIIVRHEVWRYFFQIFEKLYLNSSEKEELVNFYNDFLNASLEEKTKSDQHTFCSDMGQKAQRLQNRIYFKHIYCLQHLFFAVNKIKQGYDSCNHFSNYNFNMSDEQVQNMSSTIRKFSQNDLDSFAFVSLYMIHAVNKSLENKINFEQVQAMLETTLLSLQKLYPASTNSQVEVQQFQVKNLKNVKFEKNFDVFKFKNNQNSHYQQFEEFVIEKAQKAKIDQELFLEIVKEACIEKGYGFKCSLKIKDSKSLSAIFRTIQKILDEEQYEKAFLAQKKDILNSAKTLDNAPGNKLKTFIELEKDGVKKKMIEILQKQKQIAFDAKDLLRAKCLFSRSEQIIEAVQKILSKIMDKNLSLLDFKNRLSGKTKDVALIINLPNSKAELQLALHCDTTANQFNHKIYELLRSRIYTPITNLYVHNEKWCSSFFSDQFEIFQQKIKSGGDDDFEQAVTFKEIQNQVKQFRKKFLLCDFLSINIEDRSKDQTLIESLMKQLNQLIGTLQKVESSKIQKSADDRENQILNEVNFYKGASKSDLAEKLFEETSIMKDPSKMDTIIVKLKGDVLFSKDKYAQAIKCYEILVKLYEICNQVQCIEYATYIDKMAQCHRNIGNYDDALNLYQKCLTLYQKINGSQSEDCQRVYHDLGMTYYNKGDYDKGLEYYNKDLQLAQKLYGKQSFEISTIIHNMGLIYEIQRMIPQALSCYEKALKIQQHYKGKQSRQYAITLGNMAILHYYENDYQKSLQMQERTLKLKQKIAGKNSIDCGITLTNIGQLYQQMKNFQKSEQTFLESLAIKSSIKGPDDIDCAFTIYNLGRLYYDWQKGQKAVQYCRKAYEIRRKVLGIEHPDTADALLWRNYSQQLLNSC